MHSINFQLMFDAHKNYIVWLFKLTSIRLLHLTNRAYNRLYRATLTITQRQKNTSPRSTKSIQQQNNWTMQSLFLSMPIDVTSSFLLLSSLIATPFALITSSSSMVHSSHKSKAFVFPTAVVLMVLYPQWDNKLKAKMFGIRVCRASLSRTERGTFHAWTHLKWFCVCFVLWGRARHTGRRVLASDYARYFMLWDALQNMVLCLCEHKRTKKMYGSRINGWSIPCTRTPLWRWKWTKKTSTDQINDELRRGKICGTE